MHQAVLHWVEESLNSWGCKDLSEISVLEFGSLDINGSVRSIIQHKCKAYLGLDIQDGPGVDLVADAGAFDTDQSFDVIICCEVFEHTPRWREIISNAHRLLTDGGIFIATMAGEGRSPHSAIDENPIRDWEYYANVGAWELNRHMKMFSRHSVDYQGTDLRTYGIK